MNKYSITLLAVASALTLATSACSNNNDAEDTAQPASTAATAEATATPTAEATNASFAPGAEAHAAAFLTDQMKGDNSEIRVGKLAATKASAQGVKDFAQMLVKDHTAHLGKVTALAGTMKVPTTTETKPDADALYTKLQGLSGADFDKTFVNAMVENHKKGIDKNQQEASSGDAKPVTELASQTLPTLKMHLEHAQSLQK